MRLFYPPRSPFKKGGAWKLAGKFPPLLREVRGDLRYYCSLFITIAIVTPPPPQMAATPNS